MRHAFRPVLPARFRRRVTDVHGEPGRLWLASLPGLLAETAERWSLTLGRQGAGLTYNFVIEARTRGGAGVVLKLGVPHDELSTEAAALRAFDGRGAVRLIEADEPRGVLLLERAEPGESLLEMDDEDAVPIAASVMHELWRRPPPGHSFPAVSDWMRGFDRLRARYGGATGPLPARMVEKAEGLFGELGGLGEPALLHGDLHHGNILSARRSRWLAIDPKGVVGAPGFEVGAFTRNPVRAVMSSPDPRARLRRRIALLAGHLGLAPGLVRDWAFIQSVLSVWWSVEDHGRAPRPALECARHLDGLKV